MIRTRTVSYAVSLVIMCFSLFCTFGVVRVSNAEFPAGRTHIVDACRIAHEANAAAKTEVILHTTTTDNAPTTIVDFTNCALPDDMDVVIAVEPPPSNIIDGAVSRNAAETTATATASTAVLIEIVNTTMQGGSLYIVPSPMGPPATGDDDGSSGRSPADAVLILQNVRITVDNATIHTKGSALVVEMDYRLPTTTTTQPSTTHMRRLVQNVSLQMQNVVITSELGHIASILTSSNGEHEDDAVEDVQILIGGNSTLRAKHLAGSVQTSALIRSSLRVDSSSGICGEAATDGVSVTAGGESVQGLVGILAVFPGVTTANGAAVHLEDVLMAVAIPSSSDCPDETSADLVLSATAKHGTVLIAGVGVRHTVSSTITMNGDVSIDLALPDSLDTSRSMIATVANDHSVVAVGGIALLTSGGGESSSTTSLLMGGCRLSIRLYVESRAAPQATRRTPPEQDKSASSLNNTNTTTNLHSLSSGTNVASTVLGIAMFSLSPSTTRLTRALYILDNASSLLVESRWAEKDIGHATVTPAVASWINVTSRNIGGSQIASSVLGVAMFSYAHSRAETLLAVKSKSQLLVNSSSDELETNRQQQNHRTMDSSILFAPSSTTSGDFISSSVLGVALSCFSARGRTLTSFMVEGDESTVALQEVSRTTRSEAMSISRGSNVASAVSGVALYSQASPHSSTTMLSVVDGGRFIILSRRGCVSTASVSSSSGNQVASTVLGIAMHTFSHSSTSSVMLTLENRSALTIGVVTNGVCQNECNGDRHMLLMSSTMGSDVASSVLGVATTSMSYYKDSYNVVTANNESHVAILFGSQKSSELLPNTTMSSTSKKGSAVLGIAIFTSSLSSGKFPRVGTTFALTNGSNLTIVSSARNSSTNISSSSGRSASTLGVAIKTHAPVHHTPSTVTILLANSSKITIAVKGDGENSAHSASAPEATSASALLGIAVLSQRCNVVMSVGSSCRVSFRGVLRRGATLSASGRAQTAVAVSGIALRRWDGNAALKVVPERGKKTRSLVRDDDNAGAVLDTWIGANGNSLLMAAEGGDGSRSAISALGLVARQFSGLTTNNTAVALCTDGTVYPTASSGGVALDTRPHIEGGVAKLFNATNATTMQMSSCHETANAVEKMIDGTLRPYYTERVVAIEELTATPTPSSVGSSTPSATNQPTCSKSLIETISNTLSPTETIDIETPAPTENSTTPPTTAPRKRTSVVTTNVLLPNNEAGATVVLSTAGASGAVASTLGSGGGGMVVTAGSSVRMMGCGIADKNPRPASFEMPLQFALGDGTMRYFAGASLAHALLQCFFFALPALLRRWSPTADESSSSSRSTRKKVVKLFSMLFCGAHPFFTPAILGACSTVLNNDEDAMSLVAATGSAVIVLMVHMLVFLAIHRGPRNGLVARQVHDVHGQKVKLKFTLTSRLSRDTSSTSSSTSSTSSSSSSDDEMETITTSYSNTNTTSSTSSGTVDTTDSSSNQSSSSQYSAAFLFSGQATKEILLTLFDGCRLYDNAAHRHYASIETTINSIIAIISGARPSESCNEAAIAIGGLALLQLLYILLIRPFRTHLDMYFSLVNSIVLVVLSLAVAISLHQRRDVDDSFGEAAQREEWTLKTVEACLWLVSMLGYVQLVVQGYWAYHVGERRRQREQEEASLATDSSNSDSTDKDELDQQLLVVMESADSPTTTCRLGETTTMTSTTVSRSGTATVRNPLQ